MLLRGVAVVLLSAVPLVGLLSAVPLVGLPFAAPQAALPFAVQVVPPLIAAPPVGLRFAARPTEAPITVAAGSSLAQPSVRQSGLQHRAPTTPPRPTVATTLIRHVKGWWSALRNSAVRQAADVGAPMYIAFVNHCNARSG